MREKLSRTTQALPILQGRQVRPAVNGFPVQKKKKTMRDRALRHGNIFGFKERNAPKSWLTRSKHQAKLSVYVLGSIDASDSKSNGAFF
jgi:hypothetical protein